jgi:hypothetical protein
MVHAVRLSTPPLQIASRPSPRLRPPPQRRCCASAWAGISSSRAWTRRWDPLLHHGRAVAVGRAYLVRGPRGGVCVIRQRCALMLVRALPRPRAGAAVDAMQAWMSAPAHCKEPFPTPAERRALAAAGGITERQVETWFGNARKRVWKVRSAALAGDCHKRGVPLQVRTPVVTHAQDQVVAAGGALPRPGRPRKAARTSSDSTLARCTSGAEPATALTGSAASAPAAR